MNWKQFRHWISSNSPDPDSIRAILLSIVILTGTTGGVALLATQPILESDSGTAAAEGNSTGLTYTVEYAGPLRALNKSTGSQEFKNSSGKQDMVKIGPLGQYVYTSGNGAVKKHYAGNGSLVWNQNQFSDYVRDIQPSPYGKYIYAGTDTNAVTALYSNGTVRWNASNVHSNNVRGVAVSPDGKYVYSASMDNTVKALYAENGTVKWTFTGHSASVKAIDVGPNGIIYTGADSTDSTVKALDSNGNVLWTFSGHSDGLREVSVGPNGEKVFTASVDDTVRAVDTDTGNQLWKFTGHTNNVWAVTAGPKGEYVYSGGQDKTSFKIDADDGSKVWSYGGHGGTVYGIAAKNKDPTNPLTIKVEDKNGNAVENSTVEVIGVNKRKLNDTKYDDLIERSKELAKAAANPKPPSFNPELSVANDVAEGSKTFYPTTHTKAEMGLQAWSDSPHLKPATISFEKGETVYLYAWNPDGDGTDGVSRSYPGAVAKGDTVWKIEQLDHKGDTVDTRTIKPNNAYKTGVYPLTEKHKYATANLPVGFYRVTPTVDNTTGKSIIITVGNPAAAIEERLKTESNKLSKQAQATKELFNEGKFTRIKKATNKSGYVTVEVPVEAKVVSIQAYKAPDMATDPKNMTIQDIRAFQKSGYNGSIYLSDKPKRVEVSNAPTPVEIQLTEFTSAPYADLERFQNRSAFLKDLLQNGSFAGVMDPYLETTSEEIKNISDDLEQLKNENQQLQQRYKELKNSTSDDLTAKEQAELIRQAIRDTEGDIQAGSPETTYKNGTVSATIPWNGELDEDAVAVTAHFPSLGESRSVANKHITVNKRVGQADVVKIEDYPVPNGTKSVTFGVTVSGEDGKDLGSTKVGVKNPNFTGAFLELRSVKVSTIRPGPSETVTVTPRVTDESALIQNISASVRGPNGDISTTTVNDGQAIQFTTDGAGPHRVVLEITDQSGETWTETITLEAADLDVEQPPSVRVRDGFTGKFAIVSDGLVSGSVSSSEGKFVASAVADSEDVPSTVHYYGSQVKNSRSEVTLKVMKKSGTGVPESARKHVKVFYHTGDLPSETIIYRNGDEPLKMGGETAAGTVTCPEDEEGCTIATHTGGDGSVDLTINKNPDVLDETIYFVRTQSPVDIPGMFITVPEDTVQSTVDEFGQALAGFGAANGGATA